MLEIRLSLQVYIEGGGKQISWGGGGGGGGEGRGCCIVAEPYLQGRNSATPLNQLARACSW